MNNQHIYRLAQGQSATAPSAAPAIASSSAPGTTSGQAIYLLGFSPALSHSSKTICNLYQQCNSVEQSQAADIKFNILKQLQIEVLQTEGVTAWYKVVDRTEFEGEAAARNLASLDWLTPRVLAHEAIVSQLCRLFDFYPARFGCLFSQHDKLQAFTKRHASTLEQFFGKVHGKQEWGLKIVGNVDRAGEQLALSELKSTSDAEVSLNYLRYKQLQRSLRPVALRQLLEHAEQVVSMLSARFPTLVRRSLPSQNGPDRQRLLANLAFLLDEFQSQQLAELCRSCDNRDDSNPLDLQITGPWPAYSFAPSLVDESVNRHVA